MRNMLNVSKKNQGHILIVDDEPGIRESLRMSLRDKYEVLLAKDGCQTLKIIKKTRNICLILLDINLPDMSGLEVLKQIKESKPETPIVIMTGVGTHQIVIDALKFGAANFITKPISVSQIKTVVKENFRQVNTEKKQKRFTIEEILKQEYFNTLKSLSEILEAKDPYTRQHSKQVTHYAVQIAKAMKFSREEIETIKQGALLHDIGKIGLSDFILHKPGKLTPQEWKMVRKHPLIGVKVLKPLKLLHIEKSIIRHHHERYDGKGYPDGLKAKQIPIYARILAVADSYSAMVSSRAYRRVLSHKRTVEELKKGMGTQFDPKIVLIFLKILQKSRKKPQKKFLKNP